MSRVRSRLSEEAEKKIIDDILATEYHPSLNIGVFIEFFKIRMQRDYGIAPYHYEVIRKIVRKHRIDISKIAKDALYAILDDLFANTPITALSLKSIADTVKADKITEKVRQYIRLKYGTLYQAQTDQLILHSVEIFLKHEGSISGKNLLYELKDIGHIVGVKTAHRYLFIIQEQHSAIKNSTDASINNIKILTEAVRNSIKKNSPPPTVKTKNEHKQATKITKEAINKLGFNAPFRKIQAYIRNEYDIYVDITKIVKIYKQIYKDYMYS